MVYDVTTNDIHYHEYYVEKGKYFKSAWKSPVANINQFSAPVLWLRITGIWINYSQCQWSWEINVS